MSTSTQPAPAPRAKGGLGMLVYAVIAALVVGTAVWQSVARGHQGTDIRSALTLIAPAGAGGGWDTFQREQQQAMRVNKLVNNVQVVNIPGAAGTIGLGKLSTMDGQPNVLMVSGAGLVAGVEQTGSAVSHDDVTMLGRVVEEYDVVVVPADSPYQSLEELVDAWTKSPGKIAWTGGGTFDQLVMTDLAITVGIEPSDLTYIPKSGGGEAVQALVTGTASAATSGYMDVADQIEAGRLRALGLAAPDRLDGVDIPTLPEQGYDVTLANFRVVAAPAGITPEQKQDLVDLLSESTQTPEWRDAIDRNKWSDVFLTGPEFDTWFADQEAQIAELVEVLK